MARRTVGRDRRSRSARATSFSKASPGLQRAARRSLRSAARRAGGRAARARLGRSRRSRAGGPRSSTVEQVGIRTSDLTTYDMRMSEQMVDMSLPVGRRVRRTTQPARRGTGAGTPHRHEGVQMRIGLGRRRSDRRVPRRDPAAAWTPSTRWSWPTPTPRCAEPRRRPSWGSRWPTTSTALLASGIDGFVIATATPGHAPLLRQGIAAGIPTFCEKPVAATLAETLELARLAESTDVPVHIGFQRRFDAGYRRAREAVASGELGFGAHHPCDDARPGAAARGLHPHERRHLPRLHRPRLRHHPVRHRPRGRSASTPPARTRARPSSARPATSTPPPPSSPSTTARSCTCQRDPLQRRRPRRADGGHGQRRRRRRRASTTPSRCARPRPGVDFPPGPAALVVHGALPARPTAPS